MTNTAKLAEIAALVGHPARTAMLLALMDGRALTAGELAMAAGITPATASGHLAQMTVAGLLTPAQQGRHRYHRLASAAVAAMLEGIMAVAGDPARSPKRPRIGPRDQAMRFARSCYDHMAGQVAVAIADQMVAQGHLDLGTDGGQLSASGAALLQQAGISLPDADAPSTRRPFCRPCLDWSERRPHLAGRLGATILTGFRDQVWVRPHGEARVLTVTPAGERALERHFAVDVRTIRQIG